MKRIREILLSAMRFRSAAQEQRPVRRKKASSVLSPVHLGFEECETRNLMTASPMAGHGAFSSDAGSRACEAPTITLSENNGATDGSTDGTAMFTGSGGTTGTHAQANYTITNPDGSTSSSSVSVTGGETSSFSFSYNPAYGGVFQAYTVSSNVGTATVTVFPLSVALTGTYGASDGSTGGTATFTAVSGAADSSSQPISYTIINPDGSNGTSGSFTLGSGGTFGLPLSYNSAYGDASQAYTVSSNVGTVSVTVYPVAVAPTITLSEIDGVNDGSSDGTATFTASGGTSNGYAQANYTITNPDGSSSTSSVSLTGGQSSSLSLSYNPAYGGTSQAYTVSSDVGTVNVTVYPLPVALTETDGASDGSTGGLATFTAVSGAADSSSQTISYTITNPDGSSGTPGSFTLGSGGTFGLSLSYNSAYGGASQAYTVSSSVGTATVTVSVAVAPTITLSETNGASDGSTDGTAMFTASGGTSGTYAQANYTVTNPDGSTSTSSVSLTGGQSSSLSFSYNPAYGGTSQAYTVSSDVGTATVTVFPLSVALTETDGASDGSTGGTATFTAVSGAADSSSQPISYTIINPDGSSGIPGSFTLGSGGTFGLPLSYNSAYGGASQTYTVSSNVGTATVTVSAPVAPTITLIAANGVNDGSTDGMVLFIASGGTSGAYAQINYTVTHPDGSSSTSSVSVTGGDSSSLSFTYNPAYGGASQTYTVSSNVGTATVTVFPVSVALTETDGASDGSTGGSATFTAVSGAADNSSQTISYTITNPDGSSGTPGSFTLGSGGTFGLSFSYKPAYGGASQAYTVNSNVGTVTITVYAVPPQIVGFDAVDLGNNIWELTGTVIDVDSDPSGLTVTFGGALAGSSVPTGTDGSFGIGATIPSNQVFVTAQTTDGNGLMSNVAFVDVSATS